jgi:tetratricopeptide (TPR) repeat protein
MLNQPPLVDDRAPNKRQLADQAIAFAVQGRWEEAVQANRRLLAFYPNDAEAYNRLGKALTELSRYGEARDAYSRALAADPGNSIARRNLDRLKVLADRDERAAPAARVEKINPRLFVEEPGKTIVTTLQNPAAPEVLARSNAGDLVKLRAKGRTLTVENAAGEVLGEVEPKLAHRIISVMGLGNQFVAAVKAADDREVRIFIRETVQHPSLANRPTFPTRADSTTRAYTRDTLFRDYLEEEDEEYDEAEGEYVERERVNHEEEAEEEETPTLVHDLDHSFDIDREEE